ncbi:Muskelin N-terminus-domain-containing protein [Russula earlei]|uniref:Muskelin N-terminus-domain-containing protein n=1 Tax=Russula earlei TaxID=71964 RepID=A0ACC0U2F0_9AGAM|nr:Muskelin N-terminus-domain-containing protein [Russula earlei]
MSQENIMIDAPTDPNSRWSGQHENPSVKQWILLRLDALSVIGQTVTQTPSQDSIAFGKHYKQHPCNMKEFKIWVGLTEDRMTEVLSTTLKDDTVPETFPLRHTNREGVPFPSRYLKIVPISAYSHSFHISIWFVSIFGFDSESYVKEIEQRHEAYMEATALRHILKHLRSRRLMASFRALAASADVQLEHPLVTRLYDAVVSDGDWAEAGLVLQLAADAGLFDEFAREAPAQATWARLCGASADGDAPRQRGGHAMCIDEAAGRIYLYGGWDGERTLDDFWVYPIAEGRWRVVPRPEHEHDDGVWPGRRSCHKMAFDAGTGCIYLLGCLGVSDDDLRENDASRARSSDAAGAGAGAGQPPASSSSSTQRADFYAYHTRGDAAGTWELLSSNTETSGGPPWIIDHQMAMDSARGRLYVCGGRVNDWSSEAPKFSGLYCYDVATRGWSQLPFKGTPAALRSLTHRFGHSMVFEPNEHALYIFGGMEDGASHLSDMHVFNLDTNTSTELFSNFTASSGPDKMFAQRAVIDPTLTEVYVFCGLKRNRTTLVPRLDGEHWVFRYSSKPGAWTRTQPATVQPEGVPPARYAHQVVYDSRTRTAYLHGGNAGRLLESGALGDHVHGNDALTEQRLDDFWSMSLSRPAREEIVRRGTFRIRCQQFREACTTLPAVQALRFLQTEVAEVADHASAEGEVLRELLAPLIGRPTASPATPAPPPATGTAETFRERSEVFQQLMVFFPQEAKEPSADLVQVINWYAEGGGD